MTDVPEGLRPLPLGSGPGPKAGEPVYTVGYPSTANFPVRQVVNSTYGIRLWGSIMQRAVNRYGGLVVPDAEPGGPAANAHLKAGDWITHINGTRVNSVTAACDVMQSRSAGDKVEVEGYHLVSGSFARSGNSFTRHVRAP